MPRKVDPRERRTRIADALLQVAAEQGLEAVSLRHVAAAAGISTGMVQHYFRTKDEMMIFAMQVIGERVEARLAATVSPESSASPAGLVRELLVQLLPLDETRRIEGRVSLAFLAYAAAKPDVADALRKDQERLRTFVADQVRAAQSTGAMPTATDPDLAATTLLALVDGLGLQALNEHYSPEVALQAFDAQLEATFGSR